MKEQYRVKYGSDGRASLYVDKVKIEVVSTKQAKKSDMKKALDTSSNVTSDLQIVLLEYWDESNLPFWAKEKSD